MCTVSYIPGREQIVLTSNRDEKSQRAKAIAPALYGNLMYPKDGAKGGSWAVINKNGNACILLNGAFIKHEPKPHHTKSRGIALLEVMESQSPLKAFQLSALLNTEPFTLVLLEQSQLIECRWDGVDKHTKYPNPDEPHIWSSATLYDNAVSERRKQWFYEWLQANPAPLPDDILQFHLFGGNGDVFNDFRMNRDGKMLTVSITQVVRTKQQAIMNYYDLQDESHHANSLTFPAVITPLLHA